MSGFRKIFLYAMIRSRQQQSAFFMGGGSCAEEARDSDAEET